MKRKILAIDDSRIVLNQLQSILAQRYEFKGVTSGLLGLKYLENEPFDLVLLDLEMPVMDGFATLAAIRQKEQLKELPVVILTGNGHKTNVIKGVTGGATGYIMKPADADLLFEKIEACFEKKE